MSIRSLTKTGFVLLSALLVPALAACGDSGAPSIQPIDDQTAEVGKETSIEIAATDPDGDELAFTVTCDTLSDLNTRSHKPSFVPFGASNAYLRWTPLASDVDSTLDGIMLAEAKRHGLEALP